MAEWHHSEVEAFERFGYRYPIDAYLPHISLGTAAAIDADARHCFMEGHAGIPAGFDSIVFYRAGERGVMASRYFACRGI